MTATRRLLTLCLGLLVMTVAHADEADCGALRNHFGPFDYRTAKQADIRVVEDNHFTRQVENLQAGSTSTNIAADINYTLRVFPNHPRALLAMARLAERQKVPKPKGSEYTIACWFDRAMRFQPDDPQVRLVLGIVLLRANKPDEAVQALQQAIELFGDRESGNAYYNLGLAYFELKDFENARLYARKAYDAGFPLPGLRNKLQAAGKWTE